MKNRQVHFIGIGGIGMSALAQLLLRQGGRVSGSDLKESSITHRLRQLGAQIFIGHSSGNLSDAETVVYSSAIKPDNPELSAAIKKGIPVLRRAELLKELMESSQSITIAGAHGKTTTTSMISGLLTAAGLSPTVAAGGIVCTQKENAWLGDGHYFVAELDESDGSFLYFNPFISVITNIDYEHVDYYQNWENILAAYKKFIFQTQEEGVILACGDDINLCRLLADVPRRKIFFGLSSTNEIYAAGVEIQDMTSAYACVYKGKKIGMISLQVPGRHNVCNSLAAVGVGIELGMDFAKISEGLGQFKGVERRFSIRHRIKDITIVDDYGHHPTEIRATLETARALGYERLVVIFQPHRYSRTKFLLEEFRKSFVDSDYLVLTDIYPAAEAPIVGVDAAGLLEKIAEFGRPPVKYLKREDIVEHLLEILRPKDLVLFLGAGDINKLSDELAEGIRKNN
ncbi:MAG: UDP-N-acetylmuramate--L-alanine ligase [Candidatus Omnitrophota bacterium]